MRLHNNNNIIFRIHWENAYLCIYNIYMYKHKRWPRSVRRHDEDDIII